MTTERADRAVDATDSFDRKLAALRSHRSQVGDGEHLEELLRNWMSGTALAAGLPDGRLAEHSTSSRRPRRRDRRHPSDPLAVLQHVAHEGPGLIADELARSGQAFDVVRLDRGDGLPGRARSPGWWSWAVPWGSTTATTTPGSRPSGS